VYEYEENVCCEISYRIAFGVIQVNGQINVERHISQNAFFKYLMKRIM
jgi:hypothetical protein